MRLVADPTTERWLMFRPISCRPMRRKERMLYEKARNETD
jgi:uncharacterized DUF497 family protein